MQHFENESKRLGFRLSDYGKTIEIEHIIPLAKYTELALVTSISNAIEAAFLVSNLTFIDKKSNKKHSTESIALRLFNKQLKAA